MMDLSTEGTKGKVPSPDRSQKPTAKTSKSKEKLCDAMNMRKKKQNRTPDYKKVNSIRKLPRIIRSPSTLYKRTTSTPKLREPSDDAGDAVPGTSKMVHFPTNMRNEEITKQDKPKPSQIPRRKCVRDVSRDNESSKRSYISHNNNNHFLPEGRNIQRIHMLINPEFCPPEEHVAPKSVASTRPIPTLGQIYGRINMMESDRLNEWFMEINTPLSSISGQPRTVHSEENEDCASTIASPAHCHQEELARSTIMLDRKEKTLDGFDTSSTTTHDAVHGWFAADLEYPLRDTETGYGMMSYSPPQKLTSKASIHDDTSAKINTTYCVLGETVGVEICSAEPNTECGTVTSSLLTVQPRELLCQTPENNKQKVEEGTGMSQHIDINTKKSNSDIIIETAATPGHRLPVPSYTECLSEILQKTTNFENPDSSIAKTPSSTVVTDCEARDYLSTEGGTDQDELCVLDDPTNVEWGRQQCISSANCTFSKSNGTVCFNTTKDWSSNYRSVGRESCSDSSDIRHWNSWKQEISRRYFDDRSLDYKERCKRCHRFKKFPSSRFSTPRPVRRWRHRISFRRICRRRWNYVWKKTAERWALWSSRSPAKYRKFRIMQCLLRSIVWEDAEVQTTVLLYNEIGTGSVLAAQKTAAKSTTVNMGPWQPISSADSPADKAVSSDRPKLKHVNLGPSMFPFLYNSRKKSLTMQTSDKRQGRSQLLFYTNKDGRRSARQSDNITWNVEHGVEMGRMVKGCQYEESNPSNVERSTSFIQISDNNASDVFTDTEDLRFLMNDKVTSTSVRLCTYRLRNTISKDACTQKIIMCNNAEADVRFYPHLESMSTGTITSGYDITYYRPMTETDITHLITERRARQALYPILRNFTSRTPNTEQTTREPSTVGVYPDGVESLETETQMSAETCIPKVSMAVATSILAKTNCTSCNTEVTPVEQNTLDIKHCSTQIQAPAIIAETQISPEPSVSKTSAGFTTSNPKFMGRRTSSFISACVLTDKENERESYSIQTSYQKPKLARTATKIMSISSRALAHKNVSCTEVTINKPLQKSAGKCLRISSGKERKHDQECSKSKSLRGLESYYDTVTFISEIIINNLLKKALVGVNSSLPPQIRETRTHVSTGSNAIIGLESKAMGPTLSDMKKLTDDGEKTDIGVQYSMLDRREMDFHCSATKAESRLLSMCILNQQNQAIEINTQTDWNSAHNVPAVPPSVCSSRRDSSCFTTTATTSDTITMTPPMPTETIAETPVKPYEGPSMSNTETNTDIKFPPNIELELDQSQKSSNEPTSIETCGCTPRNKSIAEIQNNLNNQLITLSRMIGKRRPSAALDPSLTASVFTSDYSDDKWMTQAFTSLVGFESNSKKDKKTKTLYITRALQSDDEDINKVFSPGPPTIILSRDSLADVLPVEKSITISCVKKIENRQCVNRAMVDRVTSDENVAKDVKETMLQACPDICDTGTESVSQSWPMKSASVLTTQCVFPPSLPICNAKRNGHRDNDCVFVYGEPKCAVHKENIDVAIQFNPPCDQEVSVKNQCVNQSVGMLSSQSTLTDESSLRKPALLGEVLSPKVYKALYETTKLVVNDETLLPSPYPEKVVEHVDAEVEAAKFHIPDVRSAGVVTSKSRGLGSPRCSCKDRGTNPSSSKEALRQRNMKRCTLYHVETSVDPLEPKYTHARLLQLPDENRTNCIEDYMKTHLVTSCRYYSSLLTKQLGLVRENITKHLDGMTNLEACTMAPSGREELASQTTKIKPKFKLRRHMSCTLSPVVSLTDICKNDKSLKSVYYMLSAIEGRMRRLKIESPYSNLCH
ncbi:unnamed protein product [Chrysodeixis includens]|uniref:Uncharacterized protein n=1 Tax=Chrysodeixis includens TaxID=689277 RepID=A0A9N8KU77_CHRIL|nr:unnamed protein product [Chrysodeixis includens]